MLLKNNRWIFLIKRQQKKLTILLVIKKNKGSIDLTETCYLKFNVSCIKCNKREDVIEKEGNMRENRWVW